MKNILVVDDEQSIQFLFSRMFKKEVKAEKYQLFFAENGAEALEQLEKQEVIDLVISDINMPIMDGFELLKSSKEKYPDIPFFMASAYTDDQRRELAKELGATKYISKPVDFNELKETLASFF